MINKAKKWLTITINNKLMHLIAAGIMALSGYITFIKLDRSWPWLISFILFGLWAIYGVWGWIKKK